MWEDERYYQELCNKYYGLLADENNKIRENIPSVERAKEVLNHHLEQLKKAGATLEDDVCEVLRGVIEQAEAYEKAKKYRERVDEYQRELDNIRGL